MHFTTAGDRSGEADPVDLHVGGDERSRLAISGDDVDDARRETGLFDVIAQGNSAQWRLLRGLEDKGVAGCHGGRNLLDSSDLSPVPSRCRQNYK